MALSSVDGQPLSVKGLYRLPITVQGRPLHHHFFVVRRLPQHVLLGADFIQDHQLSYDSTSNNLFFAGQAIHAVTTFTSASMVSTAPVTLAPRASVNLQVQFRTDPNTIVHGPLQCLVQPRSKHFPLTGDAGITAVSARGLGRILLTNSSDEELTVPVNTWLGTAEPIDPKQVCSIRLPDKDTPESKLPPSNNASAEKESFIREATSFRSAPASIQNLILRNHDCISLGKYDLGKSSKPSMYHSIQLKDTEPVYNKQFRIPEAHRKVLLDHLRHWLDLKIVSPSTSKYNSPIFCVLKKDGSLRPVLDYRALNEKTHIDKYSSRDVQSCIDELGREQSTIFSSLDLTAGFWQLPLEPSSRPFTAFTIPGFGSFEWTRTPMGLLGSPASFGRLMDYVMRALPSVIAYQDDLLVHSKSLADHERHLQECFNRLRAHNLRLNLNKCLFAQSEVPYLGFRITSRGILPGIEKTSAILKASPPSTIRQIREFTGLCNYFRACIPNYSALSRPLTALLKKDSPWSEGPLPRSAAQAFKALQSALTSPPVLAFPDPKKKFYLMVDASVGSTDIPGGLGATLIQFHSDIPRPLAFASRSLLKHESNYSAYLLEMQACIWAIQHFDVYLRDTHFYLFCDHKPLEKLSKVHTKTFNRLQQLMLEYSFTICHHPGKLNSVADFLSRNPISSVDLSFDALLRAQQSDSALQQLVSSHASSFTSRNGLYFKRMKSGALRILTPSSLRPAIMHAAHNSLLGGHMGIFKSFHRILSSYYWPNMHKDIAAHIRSCDSCQRTRTYNHPPKQPLTPLPQPANINHRLHVDLFGPLATSDNKNKYICVMTDAFSKYVELVAIPSKTAENVANAIFDTWITRYSCPHEIVTDNGKEFCNQVTKKLFSRLQILHATTSPYHPQANSQVETFNRTIKSYLRSFLSAPYTDWEPFLSAIRLCYNTSISKATQSSPFSLVFGIDPRVPFFSLEQYIDYDDTENNVDQLRRLFLARQSANENNLRYRDQYKAQYDAQYQTKDRDISVNDFVYLVTPPSAKHPNPKLHPTYEGPYKVHRVSEHTVELLIRRRRRVVAKNNVKVAHGNDQVIHPPGISPKHVVQTPGYVELPAHDDDVSPISAPMAPPISSHQVVTPIPSTSMPSPPSPTLGATPTPAASGGPLLEEASGSSGDPPLGEASGSSNSPGGPPGTDTFDLTAMEALLEPQASLYPSLSDTALLADDDVSMAEVGEDTDVHMASLLNQPLEATLPAATPTGAQGGARPRTKPPSFVTSKRKAKSPQKPKAKKTTLANQLFGPAHIPGLLNPPSLRQLRSTSTVADQPLPKVPIERKPYTRSKKE